MKITIETIPHEEQRYPTVGDWVFNLDGDLQIFVSEMRDSQVEFLVGIHELVEAMVCKIWGVTQEEVDKFDMEYEANRTLDNMEDPGDDPGAPYHSEHVFAGIIERLVAHEMGIKWSEYEKEIAKLG